MNQEVSDAIAKRNKQIAQLDESIKRADNLKQEINEAIEYLARANRYFTSAKYNLEKSYEGKASQIFKNARVERIENVQHTITELKSAIQQLDAEKTNLSKKVSNLEHEITLLLAGYKL